MERRSDGAMERWRDGEIERRSDVDMEIYIDGEM